MSRSRTLDILRAMGKGDTALIDEQLGREVSRKAGVRALVVASIRRFDEVYAADLKVLDVARGEYVLTVKEQARGKSSVPSLIDTLSERTRVGLSESGDEIRTASQPVASMTTGNLEAYALYFEAERLFWRGDPTTDSQVHDLLRRAVALDPSFALAWWRIAYMEEWGHQGSEEQATAIAQAIRNVDRAPPREQLLIRAWDAHLEHDDERAASLYDRAIAEHEPDKMTYYLAGDLQFHAWRPERAAPYFEKAMAMDPDWSPPIVHAWEVAEALGRRDELIGLARRAPDHIRTTFLAHSLALNGDRAGARAVLTAPDPPGTEPGLQTRISRARELVLLEMMEMRPEAAAAAAKRVGELGEWDIAAVVALWRGRLNEYDRGVDAAMRSARPDVIAILPYSSAAVHAMFGRRVSRPTPPAGHPPRLPAIVRTFYAIWVDDYATALEAQKGAANGPPEERVMYERLAAGDTAGALTPLFRLVDQPADGDARRARLMALAELAHRAGRPRDALAALDRLLATYPRSPAGAAFDAWAHHLAGVCHEEIGETSPAVKDYQQMLAVWKDADPDLPLLRDARDRLRRLAARR